MDPPRPSLWLPQPIAGPSTTPLDIDPQSPSHAQLLAELGIKVRDFAYESKLPPLQPYRVRQLQPALRTLKRARGDGEDEGTTSSKKSKLEREDTEPVIVQPETYTYPIRPRFLPFNEARLPAFSLQQSQFVDFSQPSGSSQPLPALIVESQDSDYVATPLVTPDSSLQDIAVTANDTPSSQLDTESQATDPVLLSYSQLNMPDPEPDPDVPDTSGTGLLGKLTPMSSLSSIGSDAPVSPRLTSNLGLSPHDSLPPKTTAIPPISTSRYQLRTRPILPTSRNPPKTASRSSARRPAKLNYCLVP
ncbi:hypothetical protein H0H92_001267 [Tricholoma furcatifolium]|nr:hypothetical protein H0H92_001267 [Tricholoma furcatifolium]